MLPISLESSSGPVQGFKVEPHTKSRETPKGPADLDWFAQFRISPSCSTKYKAGMLIGVGIGLCFTPLIFIGLPLWIIGSVTFDSSLAKSLEGLKGEERRKHFNDSLAHHVAGIFFALEIPLYILLKSTSLGEKESMQGLVKFMERHHTDDSESAAPQSVKHVISEES